MNKAKLAKKLFDYKLQIDADLANYVEHLQTSSLANYGDSSVPALQAYCDVLSRGGKRLRGILVMEGYKMSGGTNTAMILQAARAMEMIHAYLLIIDDIQDRSASRRGGPSAHQQFLNAGQNQHQAEALATNAALLGNHAAMMILANLDAPAVLRSNVLSILNRTLTVTIHGQIADVNGSASTEADVTRIQDQKTATYSILNPLHVGMVLAGADCHVTDGITPYAAAVGQAFQITDDIIGVFGDKSKTGKDPIDDIREGKRTLLVIRALDKASSSDKAFLSRCLGNTQLSPEDFKHCQDLLIKTGAVDYAKQMAQDYVDQAIVSLHQNSQHWSAEGTEFLEALAKSLVERTN